MIRLRRNHQRGDTIVEVLVATVVLTIVLAGAYTVANRSTRINQTSIERTEVANQLTEQAELLRAMRSTHNTSDPSLSWWDEILAKGYGGVGAHDCAPPPAGGRSFFLTANTSDETQLGRPYDFNRGGGDGLGITADAYSDLFDVWIIAEDSPNDSLGSTIDDQRVFHIRGCWDGIGGEGVQRAEIILRLRL